MILVAEQIEDLRRLGCQVQVHSFDGRRDRKQYLRAAGTLHGLAGDRFDLVHAHYGLTGAVALTQRRAPVVTTFWGSDTFVPWQRRVSYVVARLTVPLFVSAQGRARLRRPDAAIVPSAVDTRSSSLGRGTKPPTARLGRGRHLRPPSGLRSPMKTAAPFDARSRRFRLRATRCARAFLARRGGAGDERRGRHADDLALGKLPVAVRESLSCDTPVVSVAVGDVPGLSGGFPAARSEIAIRARSPGSARRPPVRPLRRPPRTGGGVLARPHGLKGARRLRAGSRRTMRRLCMVVHGPYPVGEPRVEREAAAARDAGWAVDVLAMRRPGELAEESDARRPGAAPLSGAPPRDGVPGHRREYVAFAAFATWSWRTGLARRHPGTSPPDFLWPQRSRNGGGARLVLDVHDLSADMFATRFGKGPGAQMAERLLRLVERTHSLADAVSPSTSRIGPSSNAAEPRGQGDRSAEQRRRAAVPPTMIGTPSETGLSGSSTTGRSRPLWGRPRGQSRSQAAARIPNLSLELYGEATT